MSSLKALTWPLLFVHLSLRLSLASLHPHLHGFDRARQQRTNQHHLSEHGEDAGIAECNSTSCYRYYNSKTAPYFIESWPDVPFETGEFYGGSVPVNESDPSRTIFFIFKPAQGDPSPNINEVTIWLNGGPGCSSLIGFLQENGPFLWRPGTQHPEKNWFAWSKLTNMLWVEQPIGTGFSLGKVHAHNEVGIAKDFVGFFKNWEKLFGIENYKIYMTGESYAGRYVPYISDMMLQQKDTRYLDLSGALMYDPCIGDCYLVQGLYPTYQWALSTNEILGLDQETMAGLKKNSTDCGYEAVSILDTVDTLSNSLFDEQYLDKYLQYPPPSHQPSTLNTKYPTGKCDLFPYEEIITVNPCFNAYHITDYCPILYDPLYELDNNRYFQREDVKKAIHAPLDVYWFDCLHRHILFGDDTSPDPIQEVLPRVIEGTDRVLVSNGDWDAQLLTNGTLLSIQNMTWHGKLGFQSAPTDDFVVTISDHPRGHRPQGVMGKKHYERGLMWVETYQAGHMQPQYQPAAAWRHLQWMLGRISDL